MRKLLAILAAFAVIYTANADPLNGVYTVGTGGDFPSLIAAFDSVDVNGLDGPTELQIISDLDMTAEAVLGTRTDTHMLTITADEPVTITGSVNHGGVIKFEGSDYVTIDGGPDKNITIKCEAGYGQAVWIGSLGADAGCSYITVKNCNIYGGSTPTSSYSRGIYIGAADSYSASDGYDNDYITISDNVVTRAYYGIRSYVSSTTNPNIGLTISGNLVYSDDMAERIYYGIYSYYSEDLLIENNEVYSFLDGLTYEGGYGIYTYYTYGDIAIRNNYIHDISYGMYVYYNRGNTVYIEDNVLTNLDFQGIRYYNSSVQNTPAVIKNNKISNISNKSTTSVSDIFGIYMYYYSDNTEIINNSIVNIVNTTYSGTSNFPPTAYGIYINGSTSLKNNGVKILGNFIKDVTAHPTDYSSSTIDYYYDNPAAIAIVTGNNFQIHHNTISLTKPFAASTDAGFSSGIFLSRYDNTNHSIRNNIIQNYMTGGNTTAYAFYAASRDNEYDITLSESDNNIVDLTGAGAMARLGKLETAEYTFLADWQADLGFDLNSKEKQVILTEDGHLDGVSAADNDLNCPLLSSVTEDVDGETRSTSNNKAGIDVVEFLPITMTQNLNMDPDNQDLCPGMNVKFELKATTGFSDGIERNVSDALTYYWYQIDQDNNIIVLQKDADPNIIVDKNKLEIQFVEEYNEGGYFSRVAFQDLTPVYSDTLGFTVRAPLEIISMPSTYEEGCEGIGEIRFSVEAANAQGYEWQKETDEGWEIIEGFEGPEFVIDLTSDGIDANNINTNYRVKVYGDPICAPAFLISDPSQVNVFKPIENVYMSDEGKEYDLCQGESISFTAAAEGDFAGYKWQKLEAGTWLDIDSRRNPSAITPTLTLNDVDEAFTGSYRCEIVRLNQLCHTKPVYTGAVEINVPEVFEIESHPESFIVCENEEVTLFVTDNGIGTIHDYTWYKDGIEIQFPEGTNVEDKKLLTVESAGINDIGNYYCVITAEDCRGVNEYTTKTSAVYVLQPTEITQQPRDFTAQTGEQAVFTVGAHMKGIVPPYYQHDFQWYRHDGVRNTKIIESDKFIGAKTEKLIINDIDAADYDYTYYVVVTGKCGNAVTSLSVSIINVPGVNILSQPVSAEVCENSTAIFTVDAEPTVAGTVLDYQWFKDGAQITDGAEFSGTETNELTIINAVDALEGQYHVAINVAGGTLVVSDHADLIVTTAPVLTEDLEDLLEVVKDDPLHLEVIADDPNATYQWFKDGAELRGEISPVFTIAAAADSDAGKYICMVSNACGETASNECEVTVLTGPKPVSVSDKAFFAVTNQPNPCHDATEISFSLASYSEVKLVVTDSFGRTVVVLNDGALNAGSHSFNLDVNGLSSGVYYYTITTAHDKVSGSIVVVK
ncbi:MAG: right-handed parallel beta-helix repeat-containing protein [Candidatus Kapaibacterium sp.]